MFVKIHISRCREKSLKIPKGQSESVNRRRTDNTMTNKKRRQRDKQLSTKHYTEQYESH